MAFDVADAVNSWTNEHIPDEDAIYRRIHCKWFKEDGSVAPGPFTDVYMSVNWSKYSTPEIARARARNPNVNAIAELNTGEVRKISGLTVEHSPSQNDRSHTDVIGEKRKSEARVQLARICTIVLPLPD